MGAWPSIEEQLRRDNVPPDSALERLIRQHQDVDMLRPEEATDRIGLPLWLRVYWRKEHPELEYRADDPTGGYPRALRSLHAWMVAHPSLPPEVAPTRPFDPAPDADTAPSIAEAAPSRTVGTNVRISGSQAGPRSESDIRLDFSN